ncbi:NADH-quinone oxidoreductase subunit J [Balneolaceae bacterium YR4-1]|uniref:NADH-quinone oxidoreductase subunit J n=1 Tax=Halalkalibaculum roseum TaxID=2709311 RepID=A0A6M1T4Y3_9BACT|nr:NADH-quinone oxidoreductase subunit J [Halalkalibaculum roseum]NGP77857.1 NADH-quinone oxidoreductase subunit J [Halalkalibaculum roseum]
MDVSTLVFYFFSLVTIVSAGIMVFSKNIVHSAFALMFSLLGVAVLYVLLYADFIAATQLLVYVGGILILILFGMMLTSQGLTEKFEAVTVNLLPASLLAAITSVLLIYSYTTTTWPTVIPEERSSTVYDLGILLMNDYVLPFIVVGVLLLIAIIGAILMSTRLTASTNE